ncbi:DNA-binding response regulator [Bifidobacterium ramosum]|uniref:DNA-binding response regulator n=2 Tax=Bifidobacterium ramosum TaxID=1798158 RepID=A0A6L4WZ35_9BIFI|nr:response regulator transcription factor [Bifidobacterium ramosum]KAB8286969.1 DNA-binding response regulator [Bifidobacterium ramosum]
MDMMRDDGRSGHGAAADDANVRIRIGIVDNDPYAVAVLSTMIARMDVRFDVVWTCELGAVAISRCLNRAQRPDVLVTDMSMNDVPGTEVCRAIRVKRADVGVVGVTSYAVGSFLDEAVRCGMQALVGKTDLAGMAVAIRRAARGLATNGADGMDGAGDSGTDDSGAVRFLDAAEAHTLLEDTSYDAGRGALSPKERDVLRLYADGLTTREIADRLGVGVPTVATFERRALAKLGARSRAHAISICVRRHVF